MENHLWFPIKKIDLDTPKLSIVIPCYNEAENIPALVQKLDTIYNRGIEVILVDNGSTDDTAEVLSRELEIKLPLIKSVYIEKNVGYGHGIMTGVNAALGEVISWTHGDLQTDPDDVVNAYSAFIENPDYENCILKGKRIGRNMFDTFFTFGMGILSSYLMGVRLTDINAQPKMFHRSFVEKLTNAPNDFSLDLYILFQARHNGYEILEYPVHFGNRIYGESKGGGTLRGKWELIKRTLVYMNKLKEKL